MISRLLLLTFFSICFFSCKPETDYKPIHKTLDSNGEIVPKPSKTKANKLQNLIVNAHNAKKFKAETQVKFTIKLETVKGDFFNGDVILKTDGSKAIFRDNTTDILVEKSNLDSSFIKKKYWIAELFAMGFWFAENNVEEYRKDGDFVMTKQSSSATNSLYTVYSHPLTSIIQHVHFKSDTAFFGVKEGLIYYDKYITVNLVPVALKWRFEDMKGNLLGSASVSKISYPESFK